MSATVDKSRYQLGYEHDVTMIWHLDGVPWFDAPNPEPRHECWPQTKGFVNCEWVYRCACGAIALDTPDYFSQKNANIDPHHNIYSGDYYPPRVRSRWLRWIKR